MTLAERLRDDRGASAILIALSMVVILGIAALVIDAMGAGFNERRQDQSAADVGALAAVQFAVPTNIGNTSCTGSGIALSRCNGATEAIEVANATLDDPSLADWSNSALCGTPPAGFTVSSVSACVAFNSNNQRAWVRIPTIERPTSIAPAVGIDSISTSAQAIAGSSTNNPGGVLPFLLPGNAAATDYNCLKAGANPKFGACDDSPVVGNFGSADFYLYGDNDKNWTSKCSGDTNGRLVANIARGIDHPISTHPTGSGGGISETSNCPDYNAEPNLVDSQTGIGSNLEDGLLYGGSSYSPSSYPGRIEDSSGYKVRNGGGSTPAAYVNDNPLWSYLSTSSSLNFTPCDDTTVVDPATMESCIAWAKANLKEVFNEHLVNDSRFGWVPELWESDFGAISSGKNYHIKDFRPVYLDTTWYKCNANSCAAMYTPGVGDSGSCPANPSEPRITCGTPASKHDGLEALTAFVLSKDIVHDNAKSPSPGAENQRSYNLTD